MFAQNLCASLDEVLAPVISVLDCFPAYLDPRTAPPDMVDWLASWTGLLAARKLPVARRRRLVARAAALHAWRGTPDAVRELVELACNRPVELEESGGSGWSPNPGTPLPGSDRPGLVVRVRTTGVLDRPDEATARPGPTRPSPPTPRWTRTCSPACWTSSSRPTSRSASSCRSDALTSRTPRESPRLLPRDIP